MNRILRRFFPKGTDFSKISRAKIQQVAEWMNHYPRAILNGDSAHKRFRNELKLLKTKGD